MAATLFPQLRSQLVEPPIISGPAPDDTRAQSIMLDRGRFIRVVSLKQHRQCSRASCEKFTLLAVSTHGDPAGSPYCESHVWICFAKWMENL